VYQAITKANSEFHETLDVIEIELVSRSVLPNNSPLIQDLKITSVNCCMSQMDLYAMCRTGIVKVDFSEMYASLR